MIHIIWGAFQAHENHDSVYSRGFESTLHVILHALIQNFFFLRGVGVGVVGGWLWGVVRGIIMLAVKGGV